MRNNHFDRHFHRTYPGRVSAYDFEPDPFESNSKDVAVFWSVVAICLAVGVILYYA